MNRKGTRLIMKRSKTLKPFIGKDGLKRIPLETDQNNPQVQEYVQAIEKGLVNLSHDQLILALYWVWDFMERALINFYVVGSTYEAVKNHKDLYGDKIQVAVRKNDWESGARRIADAFAEPLRDNGTTVEYEYLGIPVIVYVLEDSPTLSSFDTTIYNAEYFKFPNPYSQFEREFSWLK